MLDEWCLLLSAFYIWKGNKIFKSYQGIGHSYGVSYLIPQTYFPVLQAFVGSDK